MDSNDAFDLALRRQLAEIFRAEAQERVTNLRVHLAALAAQPASPDEVLKQARREAHNLKGSAATVGIDQVSEAAQRLEKQFTALIGLGVAPSGTALAAMNIMFNELVRVLDAKTGTS
jgi:chemotaxis protein histidine kinase CheA